MKIPINSRGVSLISIVVSLTLLAVVMMSFASFVRNLLDGTRMIADLEEMEEIRQYIRTRVHCPATRDNFAADTADTDINLFDKNNSLALPQIAGQPRFGNWLVNSKTSVNWASTHEIDVTVQKQTGDLAKNPTKHLFVNSAPLVCAQ